jgi:hypothetical protein
MDVLSFDGYKPSTFTNTALQKTVQQETLDNRDLIPGNYWQFSAAMCVDGLGWPPVCYSVGDGSSFPYGKAAGAIRYYLLASNIAV